MQGKQTYNNSYKRLSSYIPENHFLRKVSEHIDLTFIPSLTESLYCPNNGRPSLCPELYFRIMIIGYIYSITSNRKLIDEIRYNIAYRWFCRLDLEDKIPHHTTLSRARTRFGIEIFEKIFHEILSQCKENGLIEDEASVMTDSTLFQANASLDSLVARKGIEIPQGTKKSFSNKTHISKTDPDATFAFKAGTVRSLKYKAHVTTDTKSRVILAIKITTGAIHDSQPYLEQLKYVNSISKVQVTETIADKAYGTGDILQDLKLQGIKTNIPLFSSRSGSSENSCIDGFTYDVENNFYICPNNKILSPCKLQGETTMYISKSKDCSCCPLKERCKAKFKNKGPVRYVTRNIYHDLYIDVRKQMDTHAFKSKLHERMWKLEGVMNELKNYHTLSRAQYRGIENVQIQAYMAAIAINIKRLIFCFLILLGQMINFFHLLQQAASFYLLNLTCTH